MTIESVTYISDLDATYPAEGEVGTLHEGNNHIRNIKSAIKTTFPNISAAMSASAGVLNKLIGLTATAGDLNVLQGAAAAGVGSTSIAGLAGLTATAGALNIMSDVTVTGAQLNAPVLMTAQASTSTSEIAFDTLPSWVTRFEVQMAGVSTDGTASVYIQIGDAGGLETSGYVGGRGFVRSDAVADVAAATAGVDLGAATAAGAKSGIVEFTKVSGNTWAFSGNIYDVGGTYTYLRNAAGYKTLSDVLTKVAVVTSDTFDAGTINVMYE